MKPKDMHKCDLILEHGELTVYLDQLRRAEQLVSGFNHSMFDKDIRKATRALLELRRAFLTRHDELGNEINHIFARWSNDELA